MKIVINGKYGGFSLSPAGVTALLARKGKNSDDTYVSNTDVARDDPDLVAVVEELGEKANGPYAELKVVDVPDGVEWEIDEYNGIEWVAEKHRRWS